MKVISLDSSLIDSTIKKSIIEKESLIIKSSVIKSSLNLSKCIQSSTVNLISENNSNIINSKINFSYLNNSDIINSDISYSSVYNSIIVDSLINKCKFNFVTLTRVEISEMELNLPVELQDWKFVGIYPEFYKVKNINNVYVVNYKDGYCSIGCRKWKIKTWLKHSEKLGKIFGWDKSVVEDVVEQLKKWESSIIF